MNSKETVMGPLMLKFDIRCFLAVGGSTKAELKQRPQANLMFMQHDNPCICLPLLHREATTCRLT